MKILVTGANGFVGAAAVRHLVRDARDEVRAAVRRSAPDGPATVEIVRVDDLSNETDWTNALCDIDAVVHAAARVHIMRDSADNPLEEFRRVNVAGTLNLARQAAQAGVKRFVFLSSIKVHGSCTLPGRPFAAGDAPSPDEPYAVSKLEAEEGLRELSRQTGLELVVIRPVLVYGPGVRANFLAMMRWVARGIPLPLGAIRNARSLVAIDNLADLIAVCLHHPDARGRTFLVSDGETLSTPDLLRRIGTAIGQPARLIPVPRRVLEIVARAVGKGDYVSRLCDSLEVDIEETRRILGWYPPVSMTDALSRTAKSLQFQAVGAVKAG